MKNINIRKQFYFFKHRVATIDNIIIAVAFLIGAGWTWGSIVMMQRNYDLQKEVDAKRRELTLLDLKVKTLQYEQRYYKGSEYKELAARDRLGIVNPGEKVLILPPNSKQAERVDDAMKTKTQTTAPPTPFEQWTKFLFGGNR